MSSNSLREYDPSNSESNPSTAYVDLATYGELEKNIYGTKSYFVRETIKSTWFTQIPIKMKLNTSNPDFNQNFTAEIARTGDYLLHAWLRVTLNAVSIYNPTVTGAATSSQAGSETLMWTPNFMHNLIEECSFKIGGMTVDELYSEHLDFYTAFAIPKGSRAGYNRMIGNFSSPFNGLAGINVCGSKARKYPNLNTAQELFLPLPFFFSKDSGLALPIAALPYSKAEIKFKFRNWHDLIQSFSGGFGGNTNTVMHQFDDQAPTLSNVQVWGNYALVSRRERALMGCKSRDMIIEQNQQINGNQGSGFLNTDTMSSTSLVDLRLNGAVKALFFATKVDGYQYRSYTDIPSCSDIMTVKISISGINVSASVQNSM